MRRVEFYVLWSDRTWTVETVRLEGHEALMSDEDCVDLARARIESLCGSPLFEAIGPLYHASQPE